MWSTDYGYKICKQTNKQYVYKQTTVKTGSNPNSIRRFITMKTTFKKHLPQSDIYWLYNILSLDEH